MLKKIRSKFQIAIGLLCVGLTVAAVSLTDLQSDEQNRRTTKLFGSYSAEPLSEPDNLICVLSQLWKAEFVDQGNVHVKVNEKMCFGTGSGDEEITAIVNLTIDPATGNTIGKVWYDDLGSTAYAPDGDPVNDGIVYFKGVVSAPPSSSEPFGRFDITVVEQNNNDGQYAVDGDRLSTFRIIALGNVFKFVGQSREIVSQPSSYSSLNTFSSFADRQAKRAAFKNSSGIATFISYDSTDICFKTDSIPADCYLINDSNAIQTVGSYGLYDAAGTKILTPITAPNELVIGGNPYVMPSGFAGPIFTFNSTNPATGPGLVTSSTSASLNGSPVKVTWLARFLGNNAPGSSNLLPSLNDDTSMLLDPNGAGVLNDIRSEIGPLPRAALNLPVRARAGKIL